jgi:hypothetical protein
MMAEKEQIINAIKNRIKGMKAEAEMRHRPGLKQQAEELDHLVEMLERCLGQSS